MCHSAYRFAAIVFFLILAFRPDSRVWGIALFIQSREIAPIFNTLMTSLMVSVGIGQRLQIRGS
jgi:hypothetical protein